MSTQLETISASVQRLEEKRALVDQQLKQEKQKLSKEKRKVRDGHVYRRGGELTRHLGDNTELFTDEDIAMFLDYIFSFSGIRRVMKQMQAIRSGESQISMEKMFEEAKTTQRENRGNEPPAGTGTVPSIY